jgi:HSP20 family protein
MSDEVEATIERVEHLYQALTGRPPPADQAAVYAPIPPEKNPQDYVEHQLDKLLAALGGGPAMASGPAPWAPPVSIWERADEVLLCFDVPGVEKESIEVDRVGQLLTVSGYRPPPADDPATRAARSESPVGPFRRVVMLGPIDAQSQPTAFLKSGVLEVHLPRSHQPAETRRTIAVA